MTQMQTLRPTERPIRCTPELKANDARQRKELIGIAKRSLSATKLH